MKIDSFAANDDIHTTIKDDRLWFQLPGEYIEKNITVSIINIKGQIIQLHTIKGKKKQQYVQVDNISSGFYLCQIAIPMKHYSFPFIKK